MWEEELRRKRRKGGGGGIRNGGGCFCWNRRLLDVILNLIEFSRGNRILVGGWELGSLNLIGLGMYPDVLSIFHSRVRLAIGNDHQFFLMRENFDCGFIGTASPKTSYMNRHLIHIKVLSVYNN